MRLPTTNPLRHYLGARRDMISAGGYLMARDAAERAYLMARDAAEPVYLMARDAGRNGPEANGGDEEQCS